MVHVRFVKRLVAVERSVFLNKVNYRNVACPVYWTEFPIGILEYRNDCVELVYEQANIVFLDAASAAKPDCYTCEAGLFVFLHQVLNVREMVLAVWALGTKIIDEERAVTEMAKKNPWIANACEWCGKIHFHRLICCCILH